MKNWLTTLFNGRTGQTALPVQASQTQALPVQAKQSVVAAAPVPQMIQPGLRDWSPMLWAQRRLNPDQVRYILQNGALGSLQDQAELFNLMEDTWPRLLKNLAEVRQSAARTRYVVQPYKLANAKRPTARALAKAELVEAAIKNFIPRPGTMELGFEDTLYHLLNAYGQGISVLELLWQQTPDGILPRAAHVLSARRYGWGNEGTELGLLMPGTAHWQPLSAGQFLVGMWQARTGAPGATALLRCLAPYWVGITFGWEWLLSTAQIFGVPFRWAEYDPNRPELQAAIISMLSSMGSAGYAAFPAGTKFEIKEMTGRASENPQVLIQELADKNCDLVILGQELSGGAHAQGLGSGSANLQSTVRREILHSASDWCASVLNTQLVPAVIRWNWGDSTELPKIVPDLEGDPDPMLLAQRDQILSTIPGVRFAKDEFYERHGIAVPQAAEATVGASAPQDGLDADGPTKADRVPGDSSTPVECRTPIRGPRGPYADPMAKAMDYALPVSTVKDLHKALADDLKPLRDAAEPLFKAVEAGDLTVIGELENFIARLDTLAPSVVGASALADTLEAALAEAALAGAVSAHRTTHEKNERESL